MFIVKKGILALAASAGINSSQSATPKTSMAIVSVGNRNNGELSTASPSGPSSDESSASPHFVMSLLSEKQELSKEEKMEMAIDAYAASKAHHIKWDQFTQAEQVIIAIKGIERRERVNNPLSADDAKAGIAIEQKLGRFVLCETSPEQPMNSVTLEYRLHGVKVTETVTCRAGEIKLMAVPPLAKDITTQKNTDSAQDFSEQHSMFASTIWQDPPTGQKEVVRRISSVLLNLEKSKDFKGLYKLSANILKNINKHDPTGLYMTASRAAFVAKEAFQAQENLATAEHWFEVGRAAKAAKGGKDRGGLS